KAIPAGLSLAIHAIGDKANHEAIQALININDSFGDNFKLRHRIEHVQVIHPDDLPGLKNSNVIASMQPLHAISDMEMAIEHWGERT
ncbi:MAG: amidohydrolase, partial [candidate division Zixibacteria bacterium]|nr:amidohydrolase [candidate division Zixibacteria bacterium]NIS48386.1 amidohydrolase [candidate division Zixibacteria bacterium]NIU16508.1 amidohydrolase [candidate division Zixibacteria bacterium]NIV08626.1 amidohydrolase [candidate division Zixibacteria bacterium]NIW39770.1 amidohydrolase [candidate division Zixibacteria bacterium]